MKAGTLRDRIRIERPVDAVDTVGGATKTWALVAEINCAIHPGAVGREAQAAGTDFSEVSCSIRFRELPGEMPDPTWRFTDIDRGAVYAPIVLQRSRLAGEWTAFCKMGGARRP